MLLNETETDPIPTAAEPKFPLLFDGIGIELGSAIPSDREVAIKLRLPKPPLLSDGFMLDPLPILALPKLREGFELAPIAMLALSKSPTVFEPFGINPAAIVALSKSFEGVDIRSATIVALPESPLGRLDKDPDSILADPESKIPSDGVGMELASPKSCAVDADGSILFDD